MHQGIINANYCKESHASLAHSEVAAVKNTVSVFVAV